MSWFGDILKNASETIIGWFDFSDEKPTQIARSAPAEINPPSKLTNYPDSGTTSKNIPSKNILSAQDQKSIQEVASYLKHHGVGASMQAVNLDLSLPENVGYKDSSNNLFANNEKVQSAMSFIDSPATQVAFNAAAFDYRKTGNLDAFKSRDVVQQLLGMFDDGITDTSAHNLMITKFKQIALNKGDPAKLLSSGYKGSIIHQGASFEVADGVDGYFNLGADWTPQGQTQAGVNIGIKFR
jgi:hypothetical protein